MALKVFVSNMLLSYNSCTALRALPSRLRIQHHCARRTNDSSRVVQRKPWPRLTSSLGLLELSKHTFQNFKGESVHMTQSGRFLIQPALHGAEPKDSPFSSKPCCTLTMASAAICCLPITSDPLQIDAWATPRSVKRCCLTLLWVGRYSSFVTLR